MVTEMPSPSPTKKMMTDTDDEADKNSDDDLISSISVFKCCISEDNKEKL